MIYLSDKVQNMLNYIKYLNGLDMNNLDTVYAKNWDVSKELGKHGWVISAKLTPNDQRKWLDLIETNGEESISQFYSECDIEEMIDTIEMTYNKNPEKFYINRAVENYLSGHYTEAAVFLSSVLDYRISCMVPTNMRKKKCQLEDIEINKKEELFSKTAGKLETRVIFLYDLLPSFIEYANRLFIDDDYSFDNGSEPPYLNRNWLMHGRMTRRVKKYECIQLINALNTLIDIEKELQNNGQDENGNA